MVADATAPQKITPSRRTRNMTQQPERNQRKDRRVRGTPAYQRRTRQRVHNEQRKGARGAKHKGSRAAEERVARRAPAEEGLTTQTTQRRTRPPRAEMPDSGPTQAAFSVAQKPSPRGASNRSLLSRFPLDSLGLLDSHSTSSISQGGLLDFLARLPHTRLPRSTYSAYSAYYLVDYPGGLKLDLLDFPSTRSAPPRLAPLDVPSSLDLILDVPSTLSSYVVGAPSGAP